MSGDGGLDVTRALTDALDFYGREFSLKNREEQARIAGSMRRPSGWDIEDFHNKDARRTRFVPPLSTNYSEETVSVQGKVYITHEVSYALYGYANGMAYKEGLDSVKYSKNSTILSVLAWKQFYFWDAGKGHMLASMAWAEAGWEYAQTGVFRVPEGAALRNCRATHCPYLGTRSGHVGDDGKNDISISLPVR